MNETRRNWWRRCYVNWGNYFSLPPEKCSSISKTHVCFLTSCVHVTPVPFFNRLALLGLHLLCFVWSVQSENHLNCCTRSFPTYNQHNSSRSFSLSHSFHPFASVLLTFDSAFLPNWTSKSKVESKRWRFSGYLPAIVCVWNWCLLADWNFNVLAFFFCSVRCFTALPSCPRYQVYKIIMIIQSPPYIHKFMTTVRDWTGCLVSKLQTSEKSWKSFLNL